MNRFAHTLAVVGLTLTLVVGAAAAARPSGQAVIDDWDDNGRIDRSWSCELALDGLALIAADRRPGNVAMRNAVGRHVRAQCADRKMERSTEAVAPTELSFADTDRGIGDDLLPWDMVIAGMLMGGFAVLIGAAVVRQHRLRL